MKKRNIKDFSPYESASIIHENAEIEDIVKQFVAQPSLHHLCVIDKDGKLLGLVNRKRMFQNIFSHHISADSRISELFVSLTAETSREIMTTDVITTTEDAGIDDVIKTIIEHNIREVPVVDKYNHIIGFITILRIMQEWLREELG